MTKAKAKHLCEKFNTDACVTLNTRTAPVAFALYRVCTYTFLIASFLEQKFEIVLGNFNVNMDAECNSK